MVSPSTQGKRDDQPGESMSVADASPRNQHPHRRAGLLLLRWEQSLNSTIDIDFYGLVGTATFSLGTGALLGAGTHPAAMAPLPLLAHQWVTTNCDTAETCCSRLLALGAHRHRGAYVLSREPIQQTFQLQAALQQ
jgi:hypothetical protein